MQTRTFYVFHLDKIRIAILALVCATLLFLSYALGRAGASSVASKDSSLAKKHDGPSQGALTTSQRALSYNDSGLPKDSQRNALSRGAGLSVYERSASSLRSRADEYLSENPDSAVGHFRNQGTEGRTKRQSAKRTRRAAPVRHLRRKSNNRPKTASRKKIHRKKQARKSRSKPSDDRRLALKHVSSQGKKRTSLHKASGKRAATARSKPEVANSRLLSPKKGKSLRLANTSASQTQKKKIYYSLQTGSFHSRAAARRMSEGLRKQGFAPRLLRGRGTWVVRIGREPEPKRLWKLENRLRKNSYSPIRVRE